MNYKTVNDMLHVCYELFSGSTSGYTCVMAAYRYGLLNEAEKVACLTELDNQVRKELNFTNW